MNIIAATVIFSIFIGLGAHGLPTSTNLDAHDVWSTSSTSSEHLFDPPSLMRRSPPTHERLEVWRSPNFLFQFPRLEEFPHKNYLRPDRNKFPNGDGSAIGQFYNEEEHTIVAMIGHSGYYLQAISHQDMGELYGTGGVVDPAYTLNPIRLSWDAMVGLIEDSSEFNHLMDVTFGDECTDSTFYSWVHSRYGPGYPQQIRIWTQRHSVTRGPETHHHSPAAQAIANRYERETGITPTIHLLARSTKSEMSKALSYRRVIAKGVITTDLWFGNMKVVNGLQDPMPQENTG